MISRKEGARPAHRGQATAAARLDPEHVVVMEDVKGSDVPVRLMYVETIDLTQINKGLLKVADEEEGQ